MFQVEEIRIQLPHIDLAARVYGPENGKPVLALHGWLDNAMTFELLAPRLQGLRIVAMDMAGHGHSGRRGPGAGYQLWDYALDALMAAHQLGWQRFSLLGHSLGGIISVLIAGAVPERIERLALIDGLVPDTGEAAHSPKKLGEALLAQIALADKKKTVYSTIEQAVEARKRGLIAVSQQAAELLASRGLSPVAGGYSWNTDQRLTLPSPLRLTNAHALAFVNALECPVSLVLAEQGLLLNIPEFVYFLDHLGKPNIQVERMPGGHHLHVNDEQGAQAVADCFNGFFAG
ncbi:alpha/beta fold hydrolase [Thiopseudomonas denitrificans]|uniref:Epoxide hydrolase n=1 Tax=Thiopseudomonas denitrificans TaxID=1501432 RepID=A0A4R6U3K0_9GAMM|nr:alpha/beta hydrolase [Thiopseudomonas denitrificans]TDQ39992.1 epoxide hydrolase [Thiopseudomonas denitrificans]